MQLIRGKNIIKQYGERLLFKIEDLNVYSEDKIGIVGVNGSGKTTLIKIILGQDKEFSGEISLLSDAGHIPQLSTNEDSTLSGGEEVKQKIDNAFIKNVQLIIADEPTSNLDLDGVKYLENKLLSFSGGILLISHDIELLNKVCNKILEIDLKTATLYKGNYDEYQLIKEKNNKNRQEEFEKYTKEKKRLEAAINERDERAHKFKKAPSRMGNSEARLHRRKAGERKSKVERVKVNIKKRINRLEVKEKPFELKDIKIQVPVELELHSKVLIQGSNINKQFGNKVIFDNAQFTIKNNRKTVLLGKNGSGKTTLLNMINTGDKCIEATKKLKIGYFKQNMDNLNNELTVIDNVLETSTRSHNEIRNILANFLFKKDDVYKKVGVLSGGERIKASFAKVFLSDINFLILDEPTNYLDIGTKNALESALINYDGPLLMVSHDRAFLSKLADSILYIEEKKINSFNGNFEEFENRNKVVAVNKNVQSELLVLENKLAFVISRLANLQDSDNKEEMETKYFRLIDEISTLKGYQK